MKRIALRLMSGVRAPRLFRCFRPALAVTFAVSLAVPASLAFGQNARVDAAIAAPMAALDRALADEARLPPAGSDAERLERMGAIDQSWRLHMGKLRLDGLSADEAKAAYAAIAARTEPIDQRQRDAVMRMLPKEGWFGFTAYGRKAGEAAFHIINHSDHETRRKVLPAIERMAAKGEADPADFARMYDRVQKAQGRPQRYGTQFDCVDNRPVLYKLEDPSRVEDLRRSMKISFPLADLLRSHAEHDARC